MTSHTIQQDGGYGMVQTERSDISHVDSLAVSATPKVTKSNRNCCVPKCKTWGYPVVNGQKVMYHYFPSDKETKRLWVMKTRVDIGKTFKLSDGKCVCSLHFKPEDYIRTGYSRPKLKTGSVPSVFNCWDDIPHLKANSKARPKNRLQNVRQETVKNTSHIRDSGIHFVATPFVPSDIEDSATADIISPGNLSTQSTVLYRSEQSSGCNSHTLLKEQNTELVLTYTRIQLESLVLRTQINELEQLLSFKEEQLDSMKCQIDSMMFSVDNLSEEDVQFYTGFPSLEIFNIVLELLNPGENGEHVVMKQSDGVDTSGKTGRKRCISPRDQFFLVLCRLRLGLFEKDLAVRFGVKKSTVSYIVNTWVNFMYLRLGSMSIWPSRARVDKCMPNSFQEKYPSTRVIIDATELKCEMPSSLLLKSQSYSNYKSANTLKGLVGITPGGSLCFLSQLYTGCISDKEITERSGFLSLPFEEGDSVMADKGFDNIRPLLPPGVSLNIPPFLGMKGQMSHNDVMETQSIAAERIHVERAIRKIKEFHIFDQTIPLSLAGIVNQMWTVCGLLTLFQNPIISK